MRPDQPHRRGGMPLEVGATYTQIIGDGSSPTLDKTVAIDRKAFVAIVIGAGVAATLYAANQLWKQHGQSKARNVALKELLGESLDDKDRIARGSMPGAAPGLGALSSSSSGEIKTEPIGKRRQRASSKAGDAPKKMQYKPPKEPRSQSVESTAVAATPPIPGSPGPTGTSSATHSANDPGPNTTNPPTSTVQNAEKSEPTEQRAEIDPKSSMTAAERKKAKKKQTRANRQRQEQELAAAASSESDVAGSSTDISASAMSPVRKALELEEAATLRERAAISIPRRTWSAEHDGNEGDADSITPTATAHTTPKAKSRSKMESHLDQPKQQSTSEKRNPSVASDASREEPSRGRNDSAPSLSHTLSPRSASERSPSIPSPNSASPPTPPKMLKGLNLLDTNFLPMKDHGAADWQEVARGGKAKKKKRTGDDDRSTRDSSLASPPESSASPMSSSSYQLPNLDAVSAQTQTEATSTSWISERSACLECEHWKRSEAESAAAKASLEQELIKLRDHLAKTEQDEKRQRELVKSLSATNASLSERADHLRNEKDALEARTSAAEEKMRGLEAELAKNRERIKHMAIDAETQEKRRRELEKANEDWKSRYDQQSKKFSDYRRSTVAQLDQAARNIAQKDAQIMELQRLVGSYQAMTSPTGGGMMAQNPNPQYQIMSPQMMMPQTNPSPMTPGFGGVPQGWPQQGYAVPQLAPAYPQYDNGAQHVAQQPPRMRYERGQPSAQAVPTGQAYDQPMWGLSSSAAASSRPPASPSRNAEISASILKRGPSAEPVAEGTNVVDPYVPEVTQEVEVTGEVAPASESAPEVRQTAESHRIRTPPIGFRKSQSERLHEKPVETRSAPSGRIDPGQAPIRAPLPITDADFVKLRRSPAARAAEPIENPTEASTAVTEPVQIVVQEDTPIVQQTPSAPEEDEYEEPVYASIRPRE